MQPKVQRKINFTGNINIPEIFSQILHMYLLNKQQNLLNV